MNIPKADLKPYNGSLIRFSNKQETVEGIMRLRVMLGMWPLVINVDVNILIINALYNVYNAILRRT